MNATQQMRDPAAGVSPSLLPHLHLVSKNRYPVTNNPSLETIVGYLLEAPKIVRDLQPMQWQYLDAPADGTLLLAWQPLDQQGTQFSSDGYIYGDAEQSFKSDVRGYTLEMFHQRSGYRTGEPVASHSRRRYRLLSSNPSMPASDPALFVIHYSKAQARDTIPAASIPLLPNIAQQINQRRAIQASGQLARKDFMLHDRSNWPQINVPHGMSRAGPGHRRGPSMGNESTVEEDEDVSRGDILDFMTPREISRMRYEQHHEWMEEILESPYNIHQIIPGDLGLGRKGGDLEELTKDFFDAPITVLRETSANAEPARVGKVPEDKAEEFKKRATRKIEEMQTEIEAIKERHAKRMAKMKRTSILNSAERKLRTAPTAPSERTMSTGSPADAQTPDPFEDITQEVETNIGKKVERVANVKVISRGGLQERHTERTFSASSASRPAVSPVKATASPVIPQPDFSQQSQPAPQARSDSNGQSQADSESGSKDGLEMPPGDQGQEAEAAMESKTSAADSDAPEGDLPPLDDIGMDVDMDALVNNDDEDEENDAAVNEWVMVDDQNAQTNEPTPDQPVEETAGEEASQQETKKGEESTTEPAQSALAAPTSGQSDDPVLDNNGFGGEFDNIDVDTAGDALASYGNEDDDLNLDAMDDSAFGDAFHPEEDADIS